jgi:hypothetical protein
MKSIKLVSNTTLGISLVLFSYIYWTVYRIEGGVLNDWAPDEITSVTVDLFYVALLLSVLSMFFRGIVIKRQKNKKGLNCLLLIFATIPLAKWLFDMFSYVGS